MTLSKDKYDQNIRGIVKEVLVQKFELDPAAINPDATLADLGLDSLDAIDLVITFQKKFNVRLEDKEVRDIRCLEDIYQMLERHAQPYTH
jgi:acyl carrier protein